MEVALDAEEEEEEEEVMEEEEEEREREATSSSDCVVRPAKTEVGLGGAVSGGTIPGPSCSVLVVDGRTIFVSLDWS